MCLRMERKGRGGAAQNETREKWKGDGDTKYHCEKLENLWPLFKCQGSSKVRISNNNNNNNKGSNSKPKKKKDTTTPQLRVSSLPYFLVSFG